MATVINNPGSESSSAGTIVGIILAIVLLFALIRWGIPAIRGGSSGGTNINVELPSTGGNQ